MAKTTKESYTWNPETQEWDLNLTHDDETMEEIDRLQHMMVESGEESCVQFENAWNEIFLLRATCETTDFDPLTILETGINFARA